MGRKQVWRNSVSLFHGLRGSWDNARHRLAYLGTHRCAVEPLEDRCMLSVDSGLSSVTSTISIDSLNQLCASGQCDTGSVELANAYAIEAAFERVSNLSLYTQQELDDATSWVIRTASSFTEQDLALQLGTSSVSAVSTIPNTFIVDTGSKTSQDLMDLLESDATIDYFYPLVPTQYILYSMPDDPYVSDQWHLQNTGQQINPADPFPTYGTWGADARIEPAWDSVTGEDVVIAIVDQGLQYSHLDLAPNYDPLLSYDFNYNDPYPLADPDNGEFHGTAVAGIAAAVGDNGQGIAGVAYDATLAGLRLMALPVTDLQISEALTWLMTEDEFTEESIDIYNNSWGPSDDVRAVMGPGPLTLQALIDSVSFGRDGLGTIHVFAAGNGDGISDYINYNGFANSRYTIAVGAYDYTGVATDYTEGGPAVFVVAPSNGGAGGILTTDLMGDDGYNADGYLNDNLEDPTARDYFPDSNYTSEFGGTSAATAVVSGVIALMLEANPDLTYRDVEHILARSAREIAPSLQNGNQLFNDPWVNPMDGLPFEVMDTDPVTYERYAEPDIFFPGSALDPIPSDGPPFEEQHPPTDPILLNGAGFSTHPYYGHGAVDAALAVELAQNWSGSFSALPERLYTLCDT